VLEGGLEVDVIFQHYGFLHDPTKVDMQIPLFCQNASNSQYKGERLKPFPL
jgi:hypothetical protein